jgi:hypothetical protein
MALAQLLLLKREKFHLHRLHRRYRLKRIRGDGTMATSKLNADTPRCPNCDLPMTPVGSLPGIMDRPGVDVYRCPYCNAVLTREF